MTKKAFEKAYLMIALGYSCLFPIYMMITYKLGHLDNTFNNLNMCVTVISILALIVFVIETIKYKKNCIDFIKKDKAIIFLLIGFGFLTISCLFADDLKLSLIGGKYRFGGLLSFVFYGILAILGYKLSERNRNIFFRSLIYMFTFISVLSLINNSYTNQYFFDEYCGIFSNINHFSTFLCYILIINIFVLYNDKNKLLAIFDFICFIVSTAMLIVNTSFACYLTIMFIILLTIAYAIKNKKKLKLLAMSGVFIGISITGAWMIVKGNFIEIINDLNVIKDYYSENENLNEYEKEHFFESHIQFIGSYRGELWKYGFDMIAKKPILGYGLENFSDDYKNYPLESEEDLPHNIVLFLWLSGGILTLIPYIIAHVIVLWRNRKSISTNNSNTLIWYFIIGHLMQSMFNNTLFYTTSLYAIMFGMIFKNVKKDN